MIVGLCFFLMFFFVPETFWDRAPRPYSKNRFASISSLIHLSTPEKGRIASVAGVRPSGLSKSASGNGSAERMRTTSIAERKESHINLEAGLSCGSTGKFEEPLTAENRWPKISDVGLSKVDAFGNPITRRDSGPLEPSAPATNIDGSSAELQSGGRISSGNFEHNTSPHGNKNGDVQNDAFQPNYMEPEPVMAQPGENSPAPGPRQYTSYLRNQPVKSFKQTLKLWNGRLCLDNWSLVALRPFILFAYPAILWSTLVYSLSIGWLIVLSESVSYIYRNKETYNFSSLGTGLVYISPFIGGVLGTAVAGKVSDIMVRFMSRRNDGVYEPEFRLVMAIPVAISTCIGLMGFGWSAAEKDQWIVPTIFFGIISFGCSLGSTTAITFAVDSYRQYAGEALVTLNFSKSKSA